MHKLLIAVFCFSSIALTSCRKSAGAKAGYFDSLVEKQISLLAASKATLIKNASMGRSSGNITLTPTPAQWETELAFFGQLDAFEKPAYSALYEVEDGGKDQGSNLSIRSYSSTSKIPVRMIKFYYHHDFKNLKKIEAVYAEENSLYVGERKLVLEFDEVKGKMRLSGYQMAGIQKMMLSDTINFSINGTIQ